MSNIHRFEQMVGSEKLIIETGKYAKLANASVTAQYGDTMVLATVVMGKEPTHLPYFPLMVDYEERLYAAGKIKGSRFIKREGRPSDEAVLTGRLIDRSIRPLFDQRLKRDVQVVITVLSIDKIHDPDFPALIAASIALSISNIPWDGPIAGIVMGYKEGAWIISPTEEQKEGNDLNILVSGKDDQVIMIEADGREAVENIAEEGIVKAVDEIKKLTTFVRGIQKEIGKEKMKIESPVLSETEIEERKGVYEKAGTFMKGQYEAIMKMNDKSARNDKIHSLGDEFADQLKTENADIHDSSLSYAKELINEEIEKEARRYTIENEIRIDGRKIDEIRQLTVEVGVVPRTHGTGLFTRGETQVLSVLTLGSPGDKQTLDDMETEGEKDYMHHYNFPGYSVGEPKPLRGPGRREIGHGALAEKALVPVIPKDKEKFPYTIRIVSETLASNGSSSQASVCGSTLALMDAGVPIKAPVAGIAMGLMTDPESGKYKVLTDIQGIEDHAGDMDFKIAGTRAGITAIQLDIKLGGISLEVCKEALAKGKVAREKILDEMAKVIAEPRAEMSPYAPRIESFRISPDKIREVIGTGGKTINEIIDATGVDIDIEDDGLVMVTSADATKMKEAVAWIQEIVKEVKEGEIYEGEAVQYIKDRSGKGDVGVIVKISRFKDGMVHISEVANERIDKISDVIQLGDKVRVKVLEVDPTSGRLSLSRKALLPRSDSDFGSRGGDRGGRDRRDNRGGDRGGQRGGFRGRR